MIIMTSSSGSPVPAMTQLVAADEDTVRDVIDCLQRAGGRPRRWPAALSETSLGTMIGLRPRSPTRRGESMNALIDVGSEADWEQLRSRNLMTVLDPMVLRTADLFFSGVKAVPEALRETVWHTIDANVGALLTFVDAVLLYEELPVFSYWTTFHESRLLELNPLADVLWPVHIHGSAYEVCKNSALNELGPLDSVSDELVKDVLTELTAFSYEWQPDEPYGSNVKAPFFAFVLGGLIFDAYAQQLTVEHGTAAEQAQRILQPKRARLLAEVALGHRPPPGLDPERAVFEEIAKRVQPQVHGLAPITSFPRTVTFLPLLLNELKVDGPDYLLEALMNYRNKGSVKDYRAWVEKLRTALHRGQLPDTLQSDLRAISDCASHEAGSPVDFQLGLDVLTATPSVRLASGSKLVGFVKQQLPGGRYQKLMYRALNAQNNYFNLSGRLREVWLAAQ
jgi:hypothetical protein